MSKDKKEVRRGGLGRGLAALIPTAPEQQPRVGDDAADIIFGRAKKPTTTENTVISSSSSLTSGRSSLRNSDNSESRDRLSGDANQLKNRSVTEEARGRSHQDNVSHETLSGSVQQGNESAPAGGNQVSEAETVNAFGATYQEIPLDKIAPNPRQPREVFDEEPLQELAHSIREFGLMQPIVVRVMSNKDRALARKLAQGTNSNSATPEYEIIMGERRWRASQLAETETIPAIVRKTEDEAMLRDALLENIHRVQLNPLEEAAAYQQLLDEFKVTQAQLADKIGRSRPVITNMIRLLKLPVDVQRRVAAGVLSAGHARALLGIKTGKEAQSYLAERIVAEGLSVRATEEAVTLLNRGEETQTKTRREPVAQPERLTMWADKLADTFDTKVTASMGKRKGKLVIEFGDLDDFDRIMGLLNPESES